MNGNVERRSIAERLASKENAEESLVELHVVTMPDPQSQTSSFRVAATGELIVDTAASLAAPAITLEDLDPKVGTAHHLLCLPADVSEDEIEALAISVWNEAGWTSPGVLHLAEGATLEGPWPLRADVRETLGLPDNCAFAWILRADVMRGAPPSEPTRRFDEWAAAFPEGMPVGIEYRALLVMRRMSRRLGAALRIAGSGTVMAPDPESAVNLRVYSPHYIDAVRFAHLLGVEPKPGATTEVGVPHVAVLGKDAEQVMAGVRPVDQVPRALRWEDWIKGPVYIYELNWTGGATNILPNGTLSRAGRRGRSIARQGIAMVAAMIVDEVGQAAIIDEDDFLVAPAELLPPEAEPHP